MEANTLPVIETFIRLPWGQEQDRRSMPHAGTGRQELPRRLKRGRNKASRNRALALAYGMLCRFPGLFARP